MSISDTKIYRLLRPMDRTCVGHDVRLLANTIVSITDAAAEANAGLVRSLRLKGYEDRIMFRYISGLGSLF